MMDNFNELDEPAISSLGVNRKIKAETFHGTLQKQYVIMVREQLPVLRVITTTFVRNLHCQLRRLQRLNECFCLTLKHMKCGVI